MSNDGVPQGLLESPRAFRGWKTPRAARRVGGPGSGVRAKGSKSHYAIVGLGVVDADPKWQVPVPLNVQRTVEFSPRHCAPREVLDAAPAASASQGAEVTRAVAPLKNVFQFISRSKQPGKPRR